MQVLFLLPFISAKLLMASPMTISSDRPHIAEWIWQARSEPAKWNYFSDVENLLIEDALTNRQQRAVLDGYSIDLDRNMLVYNNDQHEQRDVKRVVRKKEDKRVRVERFMNLPVASDRSIGGQYGFVSPFVIEVRRHLGLAPDQLPSNKSELIPVLVEKAAQGFLAEGQRLEKQREAEKLARLLLEKKNGTMKEVWQRCAYLYSLNSFLYQSLNAAMRLVGSTEGNETWRSKVPTLGPFCLLLWDNPFNIRMKTNIELYRGATLSPEQIAAYKAMAEREEQYGSFQGFSSCSRNRTRAENFGSALFIIQVKFAFSVDLSAVSDYPEEEEELVTPGVCFRVVHVDFDSKKNKDLIYVELRQRWNGKRSINISSFLTLFSAARDKDQLRTATNHNRPEDAYDRLYRLDAPYTDIRPDLANLDLDEALDDDDDAYYTHLAARYDRDGNLTSKQ